MNHKVLEALNGFLVDINTLNPDPDNARKHDKRNMEAIQISLEEYGQHQPIVVQKEGLVVRIGNGRLEAAKNLGWTHIAAIVIEESNINAIRRSIADNKSSDLSKWDFGVLGNLFGQLNDEGADLLTMGWTDIELSSMFQISLDDESGEVVEMLHTDQSRVVTGNDFVPSVPSASPISSHREYTEEDMQKANLKKAEYMEPNNRISGTEVVCPHCAKTFVFRGN